MVLDPGTRDKETAEGRTGSSSLLNVCWAETCKIAAFPVTRLFYLGVFVVLALYIAFWRASLSHDRTIPNALYAVPNLFIYTWFCWLFQIFLIGFCAYLTAADFDHGMIRVVLVQPHSRWRFLIARYLAIGAHAAFVTAFFVLCHLAWSLFYWGLKGGRVTDAIQLGIFAGYVVLFAILLSWIVISCSLFRTSVLGALITSWVVVLGVSVIWMSSFRDVPNPIFFKYFSFPFTAVLYQFSPSAEDFVQRLVAGKTLSGFLATGLLTVLLLGIPAVLRYRRRDIGS